MIYKHGTERHIVINGTPIDDPKEIDVIYKAAFRNIMRNLRKGNDWGSRARAQNAARDIVRRKYGFF